MLTCESDPRNPKSTAQVLINKRHSCVLMIGVTMGFRNLRKRKQLTLDNVLLKFEIKQFNFFFVLSVSQIYPSYYSASQLLFAILYDSFSCLSIQELKFSNNTIGLSTRDSSICYNVILKTFFLMQ